MSDPIEQQQESPATPITLEDVRGLIDGLKNEFSQQITGMGTKLKKSLATEIETKMEADLKRLFNPGAPGGEQSTPDAPPTEQPPAAGQGDGDLQAKLKAMLEPQLQAQQSQLAKMAADLKAAQDLAATREREAVELQVKNRFYDVVRDRVHDPAQFLNALQTFKGVEVVNGQLGQRVRDPYDNETFVPVTDQLDNLFRDPSLSFHLKARPGSGTGQANGQGTPPSQPPKDLKGTTASALASKIQGAADPFAAMLKEIN